MEGTAGAPAPEPEVSTEGPSRYDKLLANRKRLLIALVLIVLAAGVAVGSAAIFSSSSASAGNAFTAGKLQISGGNGVILTADKMIPGQTVAGTATIQNTGDVSGKFSLIGEITADTAGTQPGAVPLSGALTLKIQEGATVVYDGPYAGFPGLKKDLGTWTAGSSHTYNFTVTFPNNTAATDNKFQGGSTTMKFTWDAVTS